MSKGKTKVAIATEVLALIFSLGVTSIVWSFGLSLAYLALSSKSYLCLLAVPLLTVLFYILIVFMCRLIIPRIKPGKYIIGKDSMAIIWYLHICLNRSAKAVGLLSLIRSSNILKFLFYRALGAKISYSANYSIDLEIADPQLTTIEQGVVIGGQCYIGGHAVKGNQLILSPVRIEKEAFVSFGCLVSSGSIVGAKAVIEPGNKLYNDQIESGGRLKMFEWDRGSTKFYEKKS